MFFCRFDVSSLSPSAGDSVKLQALDFTWRQPSPHNKSEVVVSESPPQQTSWDVCLKRCHVAGDMHSFWDLMLEVLKPLCVRFSHRNKLTFRASDQTWNWTPPSPTVRLVWVTVWLRTRTGLYLQGVFVCFSTGASACREALQIHHPPKVWGASPQRACWGRLSATPTLSSDWVVVVLCSSAVDKLPEKTFWWVQVPWFMWYFADSQHHFRLTSLQKFL